MTKKVGDTKRSCWCGDSSFVVFCEDYLTCTNCGTLVSQASLSNEELRVQSDESDFYGKEYWLSHMREDLGFPDIRDRVRHDLCDRCLYWLRTLLAYRAAPAKVLELGCAHGGFVALARWAGYDCSGLEMSPWVVDFARRTFRIPMLTGPVEERDLQLGSLDVIVLNDVLEHLPDPVGTMRRCCELLKPDGFLIVQTPEYPEEKTYDTMVAEGQLFLEHVRKKANEHLYLFIASQESNVRMAWGLQC